MKKFQPIRFIRSLILLVLVSAFVGAVGANYGFTDNATSAAVKVGAVLLAIGFIGGLANGTRATNLAYADGFVISDTTYAGEVASQFIVKAITGADTIAGGHCYVKDGIPKQFTIPRWDANYEDLIQDRAATPTSKGSMTVDGKVLTPEDYMIYMEFNPRDFEDHWYALMANKTLIDKTLPVNANAIVVQEILKRHAKYLNKMLWNGDKSLATIYKYWDGWVTKALADADVVDTGSYAALTKSNIVEKMKLGYDAIPDALKYDPQMKFFMNYKTFNLFDEAQKEQTYKGVDFTRIAVDSFYGRQVVKIADMPDNCYLIAKGTATTESNLWVGCNSVQDASIQLDRLQKNSELWFMKMLCKVDVQFGWGAEVVLYHPSM